ncbi:uncharacterized protein LOC127872369 [Dreissena polymorpha]|nr:uncharacterized protein LOC127872369 [Dreissena polymorpha]
MHGSHSVFLLLLILILHGQLYRACIPRRRRICDHTPPTLSGCPGNLRYFTDPRKHFSTQVRWTEPTAWDNWDGRVGAQRINGLGPGQIFYAGDHVIRYMAKDHSGNTATCAFTVTVTAQYCKRWTTVRNGWISCDMTDQMLVGTVCKFGCHPGYILQGSDTAQCLSHDRWSVPSQPVCNPRLCGQLVPGNKETAITCKDGYNFKSVCQYTCTNGFGILPGHNRVRTCDASGNWTGEEPICRDVTPPKYTSCHPTLVFYASRSSEVAIVSWQVPVYSDNAGLASTVSRQVEGPSAGNAVAAGTYTVVYQAWDMENNTATFEDTCIRPSPPEHGALSCDTWAGGAYCVLQCQQGYVVQDWEFDPLLTCSDTRGEFTGLNDDKSLPKCAEISANVFFDFKLEEFYYYDGDCNSAKEQIKQNFITALQFSLGNVCSKVNCSTSYVEVDCFNDTVSGRKERSVVDTLSVSAVMTVSGKGRDQLSPMEAIMMQEQIYQARVESNDSLDNGLEMSLQLTYIKVSSPEIACQLGSYADRFTLSCVQCSRGTYHDMSVKQCRPCPRGEYQPISGMTSCLQCPNGTSTPFVASVDIGQCVEACPPGYMSPTGTIPCSPCDVGTFSTAYGKTQCTACPGSKTTRANLAATAIEDCYEFDMEFSGDTYSYENASILFTPTSHVTSLYLALSMKCSTCYRILEITDVHEIPVLTVTTRVGFLDITLRGCELSIPVHGLLDSPRWHHLSLHITASFVTTTIDEIEQHVSHACAYNELLVEKDYMLVVGGKQYTGSVTSLNLWNASSGDFEIPTILRCMDNQLGNLVAWKQFQDVDGPFLRTPTQCDDVNNCASYPCKNGGSCLDGREAFACSCNNGFTGDMCEINIDDCVGNSCQNGATCLDGDDSYTCQCNPQSNGSFCETMRIDGGWTSWSMWGPCSVTCGSGQKIRVRECSNPEPENRGADCTGDTSHVQNCTMTDICVYECDVDPQNPLHGSMNCSWQGNGTRQCLPFCEDGYAFDSDLFLDNIVCGPETGYEWSIRNNENPYVQIGTCSVIHIAEENILIYSAEYDDLTPDVVKRSQTDVPAVIQSTVQANVYQLPCVQNRSCRLLSMDVTNTSPNRVDFIRERRDVQLVGFDVKLTCTPTKAPRSCYDLLEEAYFTLQRLVNEPDSPF